MNIEFTCFKINHRRIIISIRNKLQDQNPDKHKYQNRELLGSLNQAALAYILTRNEISTCIPGAKSIQHLKSNIESVNVKLENSELKND